MPSRPQTPTPAVRPPRFAPHPALVVACLIALTAAVPFAVHGASGPARVRASFTAVGLGAAHPTLALGGVVLAFASSFAYYPAVFAARRPGASPRWPWVARALAGLAGLGWVTSWFAL